MSLRLLWIILSVYDPNSSRPRNSFSFFFFFFFKKLECVVYSECHFSVLFKVPLFGLIKHIPHYLAELIYAI